MKHVYPPPNLLEKYILQLRFGEYQDTLPTRTLHSYKTIAWLLQTKKGRVRRVCQKIVSDHNLRKNNFLQYFQRKSQPIKKKKFKFVDFTDAEKQWATLFSTLTRQVSLNLQERSADFNNHFKTDKANKHFIRKIYKEKMVRLRMVRDTKILTPEQEVRQRDQILALQTELQAIQLEGYKLVQLDEVMATVGTIPKRLWTPKNESMKIDKKWINSQTIASCAAISADNGVEHVGYFRRSLDADDFCKYLKELRVKLGDEKVCLFMDQLSVHRSYKARDKMTELGFKWLFNAAYYPDGNGIELIFAQVKLKFKKMRVQAILNGKRDRARVQLRKAFEGITQIQCARAIQHSLNTINSVQ